MSIRRYDYGDFFDSMIKTWDFTRPMFSYLKGEFYDPEKYELTPRKDYAKKELARKEEELTRIKERHRMVEKQLTDEIDGLKKKLSG